MYKLPFNVKGVLRIEDNSFIQFDLGNMDYKAYLKLLDEGNTPIPADETSEG
jgi:hypothetical protein